MSEQISADELKRLRKIEWKFHDLTTNPMAVFHQLRTAMRTETLKYLCACYADIDCYRAGLTVGKAFGKLVDAAKAGVIPAPSIVFESGRVMWVLWLLHDPNNPDQAHHGAWSNNVELYTKVQRRICSALAGIGCDPQGTDASRHIRINVSLNTKSEEQVRWWLWGRGNSAISYTLKDLAQFFGITPIEVSALTDVTLRGEKVVRV